MKKKGLRIIGMLIFAVCICHGAATPDDRDPYRYKMQLLGAFSRLAVDMQTISGLPLNEGSAVPYRQAVNRAIPTLFRIRNLRPPKALAASHKDIARGAEFTSKLFQSTTELLTDMAVSAQGNAVAKAAVEAKAAALSRQYASFEKEMLTFMAGTVDALAYDAQTPQSDPYRGKVMDLLTRIYKETQPIMRDFRRGRAPSEAELNRYTRQSTPLYQELADIPDPPVYMKGAQAKLKRGAAAYLEHRRLSFQSIGILLQSNFNITPDVERRLTAIQKRMRALSKEAGYFNEGIADVFSY